MADSPEPSSRTPWRFTYFPERSAASRNLERLITILAVLGTVWVLVVTIVL